MTQSAADILKAALGHMEDRAATYDKPEGERSMPATVAAFNALTGHQLTAEQGWLFMTVLKLCRTQQGGFRADNYEDGSAYFALMGEQAAGDREIGGRSGGAPSWATHTLVNAFNEQVYVKSDLRGWVSLCEDGATVSHLYNERNTVANSLKPIPKAEPIERPWIKWPGGAMPGEPPIGPWPVCCAGNCLRMRQINSPYCERCEPDL